MKHSYSCLFSESGIRAFAIGGTIVMYECGGIQPHICNG